MEKAMDPRLDGAVTILASYKAALVDVLTQQVPDDQDKVEMDFSIYEELS
jgi:hypothetical protein